MQLIRCDVEGCDEEYETDRGMTMGKYPIGWRVEHTSMEVDPMELNSSVQEDGDRHLALSMLSELRRVAPALPEGLRPPQTMHVPVSYHICPNHPSPLTMKKKAAAVPLGGSAVGGLRH